MKKLLAVAVIGLVVFGIIRLAGGRSEAQQARVFCEQLYDLCGREVDMTASDVPECTRDMERDGRRDIGDAYGSMIDCIDDADTCSELSGCVLGAVGGGDVRGMLRKH